MIKGKRKDLSPEENLENILNANAGLPSWRRLIKRPRRRVTIAYHWLNDDGKEVWAEFEWRRRFYSDPYGKLRVGALITYHRQQHKPKGGFIANGKSYSILRPGKGIVKARYQFEPGKTIQVPEDIVKAFREIWQIDVNRDLISKAYDMWKQENLPQLQQ